MTRFVHPRLDDVSLSAVLHALADPMRRRILSTLSKDKACDGKGLACSAAAPPEIPKATLSHHFSVLRAAGLVRAEKRGVEVIHVIRCDEVDRRFPGVLAAILAAEDTADAA
ncbi:MAG: helix-turn-helix domain-containing protein [Parvularculaceae bacterium]|nr:helix-turn-helix domain-containing protein [Parvularculaceae bacterium]